MYPKTLTAIENPALRARIAIERRIVKRTVDAFLAAGFALQTDQGSSGEELVPETPTTDRKVILDQLCETDDERLFVSKGGKRSGWIYFVYGNSGGFEVICDYTVNVEDVLAPVNDYANHLEETAFRK